MSLSTQPEQTERSPIVLGLLESVERDGAQSQRKLAAELGIALGLVNSYLRRCVKKGLLKVGEAPSRRYAYYLTPQGFAEKSRLTVEYLTASFSFFRRARADCSQLFGDAEARGWHRIALLGVSDLAEIAAICALDRGMTIAAVVDSKSTLTRFVGIPVVASFKALVSEIDAVVVTDLQTAAVTVAAAVEELGLHRVLVPELLKTKTQAGMGLAARGAPGP